MDARLPEGTVINIAMLLVREIEKLMTPSPESSEASLLPVRTVFTLNLLCAICSLRGDSSEASCSKGPGAHGPLADRAKCPSTLYSPSTPS